MRSHPNDTYRPARTAAPPRPPHGKTATAESRSGATPIHVAPSPNASIIGRAPCGAQLTVLGRLAGWHAVRYGPCQGYVANAEIVLNY